MSIYAEYLAKITGAYRDASNGFHPPEASKKIYDALAGFVVPLNNLDAAIQNQRAGRYPSPQDYAPAWQPQFQLAEWQYSTLSAAVDSAAVADRQKMAATIVDQSVAVRHGQAQQATDGVLLQNVTTLLQGARNDAIAAGELRPSGGSDIGSISVDALKKYAEERAAPKEDRIFAEQLAIVGGQSAEAV